MVAITSCIVLLCTISAGTAGTGCVYTYGLFVCRELRTLQIDWQHVLTLTP